MSNLLPEILEDGVDHLMSYLSPGISKNDIDHLTSYPLPKFQGSTSFNINAQCGTASDTSSLVLRMTSRISSSIKADLGHGPGGRLFWI
ncbi:hypothetical protein BHM03_00048151 [Ensete ventricosum]|nr:hypothetical protein BHM03_00048151 [Ensete ventricosum]